MKFSLPFRFLEDDASFAKYGSWDYDHTLLRPLPPRGERDRDRIQDEMVIEGN